MKRCRLPEGGAQNALQPLSAQQAQRTQMWQVPSVAACHQLLSSQRVRLTERMRGCPDSAQGWGKVCLAPGALSLPGALHALQLADRPP